MIFQKYFFPFFAFLPTFLLAQGNIKAKHVPIGIISSKITVKGKFKDAINWTDIEGEHIVVISETGIYTNTSKQGDETRNAELFAIHYILGEPLHTTWKIYDGIKDCPFDVEANYISNTFQITDLNKDGIAEVWVMYKTSCRSDVSPSDMKIIMYQGKTKFAMRGENKVKISEMKYLGGNYTFDNSFLNAPESFRSFAIKLWNKNIMEEWN